MPVLHEIHICVQEDQLEEVKNKVKQGADVNAKDQFYQTPLHIAAAFGRYEIARYLIDSGARIEEVDNKDQTPLHYAVAYNHTRLVSMLCNRELINARNIYGQTPFIICCLKLYFDSIFKRALKYDMFGILLDRGANINARDNNGRTALHLAILMKCPVVAKELVDDRDIDLNVTDNEMYTVLDYARTFEFEVLATAILDRMTENNKNNNVNIRNNEGVAEERINEYQDDYQSESENEENEIESVE